MSFKNLKTHFLIIANQRSYAEIEVLQGHRTYLLNE